MRPWLESPRTSKPKEESLLRLTKLIVNQEWRYSLFKINHGKKSALATLPRRTLCNSYTKMFKPWFYCGTYQCIVTIFVNPVSYSYAIHIRGSLQFTNFYESRFPFWHVSTRLLFFSAKCKFQCYNCSHGPAVRSYKIREWYLQKMGKVRRIFSFTSH